MTRLGSARWISFAAIAALLSIVATTSFARPAAAADAQLELVGDPVVISMMTLEQTLLDLTNADRAMNGLPALDFDGETLAIARQRAASQLGQNNLSHYDERGLLAFVRLLDAASLRYDLAGENLARSSSSGADLTQRIERALMQSPTHRKNILEKRFARASIGVASDADGRVAFAEIFRGD